MTLGLFSGLALIQISPSYTSHILVLICASNLAKQHRSDYAFTLYDYAPNRRGFKPEFIFDKLTEILLNIAL